MSLFTQCVNDEGPFKHGNRGERFWVRIVRIEGNTIHGVVAQDLVVYPHLFVDKQEITVKMSQVYGIYVEG